MTDHLGPALGSPGRASSSPMNWAGCQWPTVEAGSRAGEPETPLTPAVSRVAVGLASGGCRWGSGVCGVPLTPVEPVAPHHRPEPAANALAWVLVAMLGPTAALGAVIALIVPGWVPVLVIAAALAGMVACAVAAARLADHGRHQPYHRLTRSLEAGDGRGRSPRTEPSRPVGGQHNHSYLYYPHGADQAPTGASHPTQAPGFREIGAGW